MICHPLNRDVERLAVASARLGFTVTQILADGSCIGYGAPVKGPIAAATSEGWEAFPHIPRWGNPHLQDDSLRWAWDDGWTSARDHCEGTNPEAAS